MEGAGFLVYTAVKVAAYVGWCGVGVKLHGHTNRIALKAFLFGIVRVAMGAVIGLIAIVALANIIMPLAKSSVATYLMVYIPVRWVEWSLMALMMDREHRTLMAFLGGSSKSALWRLGGIVISCLADIPIIREIGGLPVGRFMC